jgi:hypothetical protein
MSATSFTANKLPFIEDEQLSVFIEDFALVFKLGIATHELYGHGSSISFDQADIERGIADLLKSDRLATTFYAPGQTFQTVFGGTGLVF